MENTQSFTAGKSFSPLIRFSVPVFFAQFLQAMYGAADLLKVGQSGGELAGVYTLAVAAGSQITQTITFVITSLAMGLIVFVGEKIGARQSEEAGKIIGSGVFLFGVIGVILTVVLMLTSPLIAKLMRAPAEAFDDTVSYITICSAGMLFVITYNVLDSIFRGIGDAKIPLYAVIIACVFNVLGGLLFVAVFHMGAAGTTIATTLAQGIGVLISFLII